jgi:hypothetical protein
LKSRTTRRFWGLFEKLPDDVQDRARKTYEQFREDPAHPGLRFKRVDDDEPLYSVRIGIHYRAVGLLESDTITWFWIGSHTDYERLLSS